MFLMPVRGLILGAALMLSPAQGMACEWTDADGTLRIQAGHCSFAEIAQSGMVEVTGRVALARATIHVGRGATLELNGTQFDELRLLSTPEARANLIAEAATLRILDLTVQSYDPHLGGPDRTMEDGRAFLRVDAFVDDAGQPANGRLVIERSRLSHLGYDSRYANLGTYSSYGISLKVRSEADLRNATVTGHILDSTLSHNYRGFYSYGALDFVIRDSEVHDNADYGVDGHDDTDGLIVAGNHVHSNGGTGIICSRRCGDNVFENNEVHGNGANGIVLHDLSVGGRIRNNTVYDNHQDGIVVHDSQNTLVSGNEIRGNRYGVRVFSGSVATRVTKNRFGANEEADVFVKHGNLAALGDLSDYSDGTNWNSQNIARHNSSRIWGTEFVGNSFTAPARILARGADYLRFSGNDYGAAVAFDIRSSDNIELDGADARGQVTYLLRAQAETVANYRIVAAPGAELSMTGYDRVILSGETPLIPAGSGFRLRLDAHGPSEVTLQIVDRQDIRTGVLAPFPIVPISGTGTITEYRDKFAAKRSVEMMIETGPAQGLSFRAFGAFCSGVRWTFGTRSFVAFGKDIIDLNGTQNEPLVLRCL